MKLKWFNIIAIGCVASLSPITACRKDEPVEPVTFAVTIDLDGGTLEGEPGTITKTVGEGATYRDLGTPQKTDNTFKCWTRDGVELSLDEVITENVSIKAEWNPNFYTVTIDLNGGKLEQEMGTITKTVSRGSTYSSLGIPTKNIFTFKQWEKNGTPVDPTDVIDDNVSIKATWNDLTPPTIVPKTAKFYLPKTTGGSIVLQYIDSGTSLDVYLINNSQIPYIRIDDLFDEAIWPDYYNITKIGNVFVVTNELTSTGSEDVTCTFDIDEQTITFNDYDKFVWYYTDYAENPLATGCVGGETWQKCRVDEYTSGGTYTINLVKYDIPIYCDNEIAYIPYDFCYNIFDYDLVGYDWWGYKRVLSGTFMFLRNNFYEILNQPNTGGELIDESYAYYLYGDSQNPGSARALENIPDTEPLFNSSYREYCYNLLALTLDTRFGMTVRPSRSNPGEIIKYFPNGAYESIAQYHDDFVSNELDASNNAMINIMKYFCDDGGHAGYSGCDVTAKTPWSTLIARGPETTHTFDVSEWMGGARTDAGHDLPEGYDSYIETLSSEGDKQDIAWVTFDSFIAEQPDEYGWTYNDINEDNYMDWGTEGMTMRLQQIINAPNSKIKYVVIDLSNNGGGTVYTEHMLASYLCGRDNRCEPHDEDLGYGGVTHTIWNPHSKAFSKYTYYADINEDGKYDSNDYLPEDVELYCIVSDGSFSCGNMLPCHLEACSDCKFIGSKSGGGACYVDSNMHIGLGNVFRSSSNYHSLKYVSTPENPITADEGVEGSFYPIPCDEEHALMFFDRATIIHHILGNL